MARILKIDILLEGFNPPKTALLEPSSVTHFIYAMSMEGVVGL